MIRVSATIVDLSLPGSLPQPLEFTFEGSNWYDAMARAVHEYSAQCRGGRIVDADRLELRSFVAINVDRL